MHVRIVGVRVLLALKDLGEQQPLEGALVQFLRQRPAEALLDGPLHVIAHGALGDAGRRRDPLVAQSRLELQAQDFFDFAHGTPLRWHRLSPRTKSGSLASGQGSSADPAGSFRGERDRGFRDRDRRFRAQAQNRSPSSGMSGHVRPERPVTFSRNQRSRWSGIRMVVRQLILTMLCNLTSPRMTPIAAVVAQGLPDLSYWELRPKTQLVSEKSATACPYVGGSEQKPRDVRTLRRWRKSRRGPAYLKIGGRYFYTIGALRQFFEHSLRCEND